jgi:biotin carboxyl carrier protein
MKLALTVSGTPAHIEVLAPAPDARFRIDGEPERTASVEMAEPNVFSILMDGRSYEARIEPAPGALIVVVNGFRFEIEVEDPRTWKRGGAALASGGLATLASPMPGKIVRVLAAVGDMVEAGQGVVVVEAMKMQNEMKAPRAGRVVTLSAREGASVSAGEVLATIAAE